MVATSVRKGGPYRTRLTGQLAFLPSTLRATRRTGENRLAVLGISQWDIRGADVNKHPTPAASREAAVFKSNRSQAVRIPKDLAFPDDVRRVTIVKTPDGGLLIKPASVGKDWDAFFGSGPFATEDFMADRDQGIAEVRESLD